jgi:rhodanese-related sulfurtransferase
VQWHEVDEYRARGTQFVDVRTREEFARGSLPGAFNIPVDELREHANELGHGDIVVYCRVGQRAHVAVTLLNELGFHAKNLDGGYRTWLSSPAATERQPVG